MELGYIYARSHATAIHGNEDSMYNVCYLYQKVIMLKNGLENMNILRAYNMVTMFSTRITVLFQCCQMFNIILQMQA